MESIAYILVIIVLATIGTIVAKISAHGIDVIFGRTKPLPPKVSSLNEIPVPSFHVRGWIPNSEEQKKLSLLKCHIHHKKCIAFALVDFYKPQMNPLAGAVTGSTKSFVGTIAIEMCKNCIPIVVKLINKKGWKPFVWNRSNYEKHPDWGS